MTDYQGEAELCVLDEIDAARCTLQKRQSERADDIPGLESNTPSQA